MRTRNYFGLKKPCVDCPFRKDRDFPLTPARAQGLAENFRNDGTFSCHKTVDYSNESGQGDASNATQCAGALATVLKDGVPNAPYQVAERLGMFDRDKLEMDSTFDTLDEWVEYMKGINQ